MSTKLTSRTTGRANNLGIQLSVVDTVSEKWPNAVLKQSQRWSQRSRVSCIKCWMMCINMHLSVSYHHVICCYDMVPSWIEIIDSDWKWYEITHNTGKRCGLRLRTHHYDDVIMTMLASQITSLTVVYSIVYSDVNQRKHQSSASLAFVREIHRGTVNFPHKWPVTRKMFPFDDVIMTNTYDHGKTYNAYPWFWTQTVDDSYFCFNAWK